MPPPKVSWPTYAGLPAHARAHQEILVPGSVLQHLRHLGVQALGHELAGTVKHRVEVVRAESEEPEIRQRASLRTQPVSLRHGAGLGRGVILVVRHQGTVAA